jgi:ribosomal protein L17
MTIVCSEKMSQLVSENARHLGLPGILILRRIHLETSNTIPNTSEQLLNSEWVYCAQLTRTTGNTSDRRSVPMSIKNKIIATALSGLAVLGIVAATALSFPQSTSAQTSTPATPSTSQTAPVGRGERNGLKGAMGSQGTYLADALGITVADLQAAQTKAREAEIKQAVADGLITQAQADAMLSGTGGRGVRVDLRGANYDHDKFLADALGISVEKLQAAEETAAEAALAQAVTDGRITQAQADQITAERALQKYIADKGLFKSAVDAAVKDGVITQAQADAILAQTKAGGFGFGGKGGFDGGMGGPGGRGGRGGHDGTDSQAPAQGASQQGSQS